jgi:hypothetical protein
MSLLVVQHLVTLAEATRIIRFFKQKKHASSGYFFDLQDLGEPMEQAVKLPGLEPYSRKGHETVRGRWWQENAYILRVYRDKP